MSQKKISVIIPCYNVSMFIDRCMESLEKQTIGIDNLEIILINDASKDATLGKILLWEMKYPESIIAIPPAGKRQAGRRQKYSKRVLHGGIYSISRRR